MLKSLKRILGLLLMYGMLMVLVPSVTNVSANTTNRLVYGDDFSVQYVYASQLPVFVHGVTIINTQTELARFQLPANITINYADDFFDSRYLVIISWVCPGGSSKNFRVEDIMQNGNIIFNHLRGDWSGSDVVTNFYAIIDFCRSFTPVQFSLEIIEFHSRNILVSTFRPHTFPFAIVGYDEQEPHSVSVQNMDEIWEQPLEELTISLSGRNPDSFVLDRTTIPSIAVGAIESFTIVPRTGLPVGSHVATVVIDGEDLEEPWTFLVRFVVEPYDDEEPEPTPPPPTEPPATTPPPATDPPSATSPPGRNNPQTGDFSGGYVLLLFGGLALFAAAIGLPKLVSKKGK